MASQKLKLHFLLSDSDGSQILLVYVKNNEYKNGLTLSFLIDFFKLGLKDFYTTSKNINTIVRMSGTDFFEITKAEALKLLVNGLTIAKAVGTPISPGCKLWLDKFGVSKYKIKGSLYKCFNGDGGELSDKQVAKILAIAKKELQSGVAGTPAEEIIEEYCSECAEEDLDVDFID